MPPTPRILAVVVRYKTGLAESETVSSLRSAFLANADLYGQVSVLVWDNSPQPIAPHEYEDWFVYHHAVHNEGVSGAYNGALTIAEQQDCPWLLLLDQDTSLPAGYLERMLMYALQFEGDEAIATVVPFVRSNQMLVSPRKFGRWVRNDQIDRAVSGRYLDDAYAVNSGTLMRAQSLRQVGGYSPVFWLDLSDAYIFHVLHLAGKHMYIAGDLEVPHSIATLDFNADMSIERYQSFLAAESLFAREYRSRVVNAVHSVWLLMRSVRQFKRYSNKAFAKATMRCFWQRVALSDAAARREWLKELAMRAIPRVSLGQVIG